MASSGDSSVPGSAELSELEVALLALLSIRPMTGYEILRHHAQALEPWWETPRTQIYPKLRDLRKRGLIEHEYVVQESKPNKRLYSIGPAGSRALSGWLGSPIRVPEMRHPMMMRLFLGNLLPAEEISRLLTDYRNRMAARAESFRLAKERFSRSLDGPYRDSVFVELLSLDHLIAMTDLEVAGTDKALAALRRFGSDGAAGTSASGTSASGASASGASASGASASGASASGASASGASASGARASGARAAASSTEQVSGLLDAIRDIS